MEYPATDFAVTFAHDAADIVNTEKLVHKASPGVSWESIPGDDPRDPLIHSAFFMAKPMRAYQLGEGYQEALESALAVPGCPDLCSSILSAVVAAFAGPVSFCLAVPHLVSMFRAPVPSHDPSAFWARGCFCLFCDLMARTALCLLSWGSAPDSCVRCSSGDLYGEEKRRKKQMMKKSKAGKYSSKCRSGSDCQVISDRKLRKAFGVRGTGIRTENMAVGYGKKH